MRYLKKERPSNFARKVFETKTKSRSLKIFKGIIATLLLKKEREHALV